jgi:hypothetical protein
MRRVQGDRRTRTKPLPATPSGQRRRPLTVDKIGAVRRIRALMAMGWPRRELSRQAGWKGDTCALILDGRKNVVTLATDQRIRDLYDRLCMTQGPSAETRRRTIRAGWASPLAWDDDTIDDPAATPAGSYMPLPSPFRPSDEPADEAVVERLLAGDWTVPSTRAEREIVVARWTGHLRELQERSGWKIDRYTTAREDVAS